MPPNWKNTAGFCVQHLGLLTTLGNLRNQSQNELSVPTIWKSTTNSKPPGHPAPRAGRCKGTGKELSKTPFPQTFLKIPFQVFVVQDIIYGSGILA